MKEIALVPYGGVALVSDEDVEYVSQWRWYKNLAGYAASTQNVPRLMHRVIAEHAVGPLPSNCEVDHANGDRLDNTRDNLRVCTKIQNMANIPRSSYAKGSSHYKGVARDKRPNRSKPWRAQISVQNKTRHLGCFTTEEEAARAYDAAARQVFGEFAWLNFSERKALTET